MLSRYMLQLTQVLKHEPFHDSALARFLLRRSVRNTRLLGHQMFWSLKAEMHDPLVSERYGVLLDIYRRNCGSHRIELGHQLFPMNQLQQASDVVTQIKDKDERKERLVQLLEYVNGQLEDVSVFQLPLDPLMVCSRLLLDKCRVMGSKQAPLWLVFESAVGDDDYVVMFKSGDDLRQDQLTLQLISLMDDLWKEDGFDFAMSPYKCVSTGFEQGMLQIVLNSETCANIVAGGARSSSSFTRSTIAATCVISTRSCASTCHLF